MSKQWLDAAYLENETATYLGQFTNDLKGFEQLLSSVKKLTSAPTTQWFVCFENTGSYSKSFAHWLHKKAISYREENALKISRSLGIRRGKNDQADAIDICRYAHEKRDTIVCSKPDAPTISRLKRLIARRELLVKKRAAFDVSLKEQKALLDDDLKDLLEMQNQQIVTLITDQIIHIELLITQTMDADESIKKNAELAQSVIGIGPVICSYIIAFTDNFNSITNARKFCSYIGVAPFTHGQSGSQIGVNRVSHLANKRLKSLISNGAIVAKRHDPGLKLYFERKVAEGKAKGVVLNAIKNKMMHRLYAVVQRQTPYVKLSYA